MTSFSAKLEKNKENHAYVLGAEAAKNNEALLGPFTRGSPADMDWVDGFLDYCFLKDL